MRPTKEEYFLMLAEIIALRSTCYRRSVGAVLVDEHGHVLSTGYNGRPSGWPHCNMHDATHETGFPHMCDGALAPSGTGLDSCEAIHAEQNSLLQCHDSDQIAACYCTASPCVTCTKLLLNTSCREIWFTDLYPQETSRELWLRAGRSWQQLSLPSHQILLQLRAARRGQQPVASLASFPRSTTG